MRVLIFHGYLLRGTGSNVYNANLAQALARLGHEVHLLCQDREAGIAALGRRRRTLGGRGAQRSRRRREPRPDRARSPPTCPTSAALLPVYVADELRRVRGAPVPGAAADDEVEAYVERQRRRRPRRLRPRRRGRRRARQPPRDGPGDPRPRRRRACAVRGQGPRQRPRLHGEAAPERFLPYAREGMEAARGGPRRLPPHRREPLGDGRRSTACARRRGSARPASTSRRSRRCRTAPTRARR